MALAETTTTLTGTGHGLASAGRPILRYEPRLWTEAAEWALRARRLKDNYGQRGAMVKAWSDVPQKILDFLSPETLRECEELVRLGLERKAIRLAYCRKLARIYVCDECGRAAKLIANCKNRMCVECAARNFDNLFKRFSEVDSLIPASVRSLPGWSWNVLDFSFRHDGDFPKQWELRAMVGIIRRTTQRAVQEACREWHEAREGCRLRLQDGFPIMSANDWPVAGAADGEARELIGWIAVHFPAHIAPDNAARKRGERGAKKKVPARWELRFGYELIRVTEFGFDNVNAHFHCAYFGPRLNYWKEKDASRLVCGGRLVEIFKEESRKPRDEKHPSKAGLGVESYTVYFEPASHGFLSVLAHALKYTKKLPSSTPEKLAGLEFVLKGTRRVALLGAHYGVPLKAKPPPLKCPSCGGVVNHLKGLGLVPLSEVADLPDVVEDRPADEFGDKHESDSGEGIYEEVRAP